jgi:hypothetical protein
MGNGIENWNKVEIFQKTSTNRLFIQAETAEPGLCLQKAACRMGGRRTSEKDPDGVD